MRWTMSLLVYLDQNILSDLRQRKMEESGVVDFRPLKMALMSEQIVVVYSHVTLSEIMQITKGEYRQEHIDLLIELDAKYIDPLERKLIDVSPSKIWEDYLENEELNSDLGITMLMDVSQLPSRKLSGLPIEESFYELNTKIQSSLEHLLTKCEAQLLSVDIDELNEEQKLFFLRNKMQLDELRAKASVLEPITINSDQKLGPQSFRDMPEIKSLDLHNVGFKEVVAIIEATFKVENSNFNLNDYFDNTIQADVSRAYALMNWAGYYSDDFTKLKKGKDRFNASMNDMQHVASALGVDFLISNDVNFIKKAKACFAYVDSSTVVCEPSYFVDMCSNCL